MDTSYTGPNAGAAGDSRADGIPAGASWADDVPAGATPAVGPQADDIRADGGPEDAPRVDVIPAALLREDVIPGAARPVGETLEDAPQADGSRSPEAAQTGDAPVWLTGDWPAALRAASLARLAGSPAVAQGAWTAAWMAWARAVWPDACLAACLVSAPGASRVGYVRHWGGWLGDAKIPPAHPVLCGSVQTHNPDRQSPPRTPLDPA